MEIDLDNSAFSLLSCDYRFQQRVIHGLTEPRGEAASFGDIIHKGLEYRDKGSSPVQVMEKLQATVPSKHLPKALSVLTYITLAKPLPPPISLDGGKLAIELKFRHKYASHILPNSSELLHIYLVGTIDLIYLDEDTDTLVIADYKTTQVSSPYGIEGKLEDYATSFQLPFYLYALMHFNILPAAYLDYITSRKYRMEILLIPVNMTPPRMHKYVRPAFNEDYITREIPLIINDRINHAIRIASLSSQAPKTGFTVYKACSTCGYRIACLVSGTPREQEILSSYERKTYDPLSFR